MCGSLCDAVLHTAPASGQATLEEIERANLFLVPLDNERRWYRYHHLFAELLRQRLQQLSTTDVPTLHIRASQWYEENGLELEAFHHAAAADDVERAERLIEGKGIQLHLRGAVVAILQWLDSLPLHVKDARPALWWRHGAFLLVNGQQTGVAEKLQAAEDALQAAMTTSEPDEKTRNLIGRIAAARATLALTRYQAETMLTQSRRALEYLHPNNLSTRANAHWTLGLAYLYQGERAAARQVLLEAISLSQASRDTFTTILATISLGLVQESENQLHLAAETYRRVLQLTGDQPLQIINEAHLGLARILYEWNDLAAAEDHGRQSLELARQYDRVIDRFILSEVFLARLKVARGDVTGAAALLAQADQAARQQNFVQRIPDVAAAQVLILLRQGNLAAAAHLAQLHNLPLSQARVHLAHGEAAAALVVLEPVRQQAKTKAWADERLKVLVLQALAHQAHGDKEQAVRLLGDALALAEPEGFIRLFVDEGLPMAQLLGEVAARGLMPTYVGTLLALFAAEEQKHTDKPALSPARPAQPLIEPLSERELEVLHLIAQGLSNHEICARLFLALSTVKGRNRIIFDKLQVQRRTEAVARARALGLL